MKKYSEKIMHVVFLLAACASILAVEEYALDTNLSIETILKKCKELYGMLYYADIYSFEERLHSEMEKIILFDELPNSWTYPEIQPKLIEYYINLENK